MSFLFGKKQEKEKEEYDRLLKDNDERMKRFKREQVAAVKRHNDVLLENFKKLKLQNPKMSFEEAILRTNPQTHRYYENEELLKLFKKSPLKQSPKPKSPSPPKQYTKFIDGKRSKKSSPPKPKSPSPPKQKSPSPPKQSAKFLDGKRSKQSPKKDLDPNDPNYDLEMAFKKL